MSFDTNSWDIDLNDIMGSDADDSNDTIQSLLADTTVDEATLPLKPGENLHTNDDLLDNSIPPSEPLPIETTSHNTKKSKHIVKKKFISKSKNVCFFLH